MDRLRGVIAATKGNAPLGQAVFTARCAACHRLLGEGGNIGPDLTGYERGTWSSGFPPFSILPWKSAKSSKATWRR